ncbi:hypothetical protein [Microcoleus asticus]|uniref:Uncharacterized protein n=1 Tax=Microcoleus asticus IPMA8 TaxID=2563858 RepID=A0ABX2CZM3_9CYAN|nr:hypothetical protein [Microcoleus asticus]NQE35842.1 hypothetical protein [Microcoleus asticus IPMA8]
MNVYTPANTALVRTEQRLSVGVRGDLPPHNFTVISQTLSDFGDDSEARSRALPKENW